jgi:hypothetical protein
MSHAETTNKIHQDILRALAEMQQSVVAARMGLSESSVSRMKARGGTIEEAASLLSALGLRVVPEDETTYRPDVIQALHTMAKLGFELSPELASMKSAG